MSGVVALLTLAAMSVVFASAASASVCQANGASCTASGTYSEPNVVINSDYDGFKVVWTSSVVQPYSSGVPFYWTANTVAFSGIEIDGYSIGSYNPTAIQMFNQKVTLSPLRNGIAYTVYFQHG